MQNSIIEKLSPTAERSSSLAGSTFYLASLCVLAFLVASCSESETNSTATSATATTTESAASNSTTIDSSTSITIEQPSADVNISVAFRDDKVETDTKRYKADKGDTVAITFSSDIAEAIHVHGYDILKEIEPDETVEFEFVADREGKFEVELENSGQFLFDIEVR